MLRFIQNYLFINLRAILSINCQFLKYNKDIIFYIVLISNQVATESLTTVVWIV